MHFNLKNPTATTGLSDLVETLERISITDFTAPIAHGSADHTLRFLAEGPETLDELARGWAALCADFPTVLLSPQDRQRFGAAPPPSKEGWVRATSEALGSFSVLQQAAEITPDRLGALVDFDPLLGAVHGFAAKARNGGMDLRVLIAGYSWFAISTVVDSLRRRVRNLSRDQANTLLTDFGPMLVLISRMSEHRAEAAQTARDQRAAAEEEARLAEEEVTRAETLRAFHAGQPVPEADLLDLLAAPPQPPKNRRARSGRKAQRA